MVSTTSTLHNGLILFMAEATTHFTPSATGPPLSYGMPSSGTSPVLSYSTSQTLGLGAGSSNAPLQGHMGGTSTPFNAFPYGGVHIPPSSPSLGGTHQPSAGPPVHHSLFGAGIQGPPSHNMSIGSTPFSLFGAFGNNAFSSAAFPTGGNPSFRQPIPMQGTIPTQGANPGTSSASGPWNSWQGSIPSSGMPIWGNSFHNQMEPWTRYYVYPHGIDMGKPFPKSSECNARPTIYILFWESTDDVSSHAESVHWSWPWFLPKPRLVAEIFLATWCQSNSRSLFPRLSPTTQTTFPGNLAFSRLDKVVE
jgi:hypothetical protein